MEPWITVTSHVVPLLLDDIDTDQIIPARYLKTTGTDGLGEVLFSDWRYESNHAPRQDFVLNQPVYQGARFLLVRDNFGCGSSREHAAWALRDWGIRAVIARSFADIFRSNALKNGLLPVEIDMGFYDALVESIQSNPSTQVTIDLNTQVISAEDEVETSFIIEPFSRKCLLEGIDPLDYLISLDQEISQYEASHGH